ncbi:CG13539 [Drosophila busckii]|uniref:CG13539 n=1 Tax=Drosophila busckii TaxID=30019 RepID=A0A0M5J339_DROBS|nr:uncharacterized protein LOC108606023 [Drosophila busckii]ALC49061.1 CG13539 [Drosophila busckii]
MNDHGTERESEKDDDGEVLPRFKGLPNITEGVENIYDHLLQRHKYHYPEDGSHMAWIAPKIIVLFATGNVNKVVDAVVKDLKHPIGANLIASVLVQEPIRQKFIKKLRMRMETMDERIANHPNFLHTLKMIKRMKCQTVHMEEFDIADKQKKYGRMTPKSPIIVLGFPQIYLGDKPTGVITLSSFRTLNESVQLVERERLDFGTISIWSCKLAEGYDMISGVPRLNNFRFNCINVPFKDDFSAWIRNSVHYEELTVLGKMKTIAFPISSPVFAS